MTGPRRLEPLHESHRLESFSCGNATLDGWLWQHARQANAMDSARTFVLLEEARIFGYFSLTMGSVRKADAPKKLVRGMPGYPVGMVVLARLAVDETVQGKGVGAELFAAALRKAMLAAEAAAARLVVVDAIDEAAAAFYARYDFIPAPEHPHRLFRRTKDIRLAFDAASARPLANPGVVGGHGRPSPS